jgi:hypothetical protein
MYVNNSEINSGHREKTVPKFNLDVLSKLLKLFKHIVLAAEVVRN